VSELHAAAPVSIVVERPVEVETRQAPPEAVSCLVRAGYWIWGTVLVVGLGLILLILIRAAHCVDPAKSQKDFVDLSACSPSLGRWYLVLRDWQTGIGAAIGLLGVAWSTFYNSARPK
jgi:hypothetical protein